MKKTVLSAYGNPRAAGIIAINLEEADELLSAQITDGTRLVFLGTRDGMGIKFSRDRRAGRWGATRRASRGSSCATGTSSSRWTSSTRRARSSPSPSTGYGKRTDVAEYRHQARGGTGVINVRVTEKNGPVVGIKSVADDDHLLLITEQGILIRFAASDVRETGRAAQGVKLIDLDGGGPRRGRREARRAGRRERRRARAPEGAAPAGRKRVESAPTMRFFLDTADPDEARRVREWGLLDGAARPTRRRPRRREGLPHGSWPTSRRSATARSSPTLAAGRREGDVQGGARAPQARQGDRRPRPDDARGAPRRPAPERRADRHRRRPRLHGRARRSSRPGPAAPTSRRRSATSTTRARSAWTSSRRSSASTTTTASRPRSSCRGSRARSTSSTPR